MRNIKKMLRSNPNNKKKRKEKRGPRKRVGLLRIGSFSMVKYTGFVLISDQAPLLSPTYVKYCNANPTAFACKKNAANSQAIQKGWYLLAERERGKKRRRRR